MSFYESSYTTPPSVSSLTSQLKDLLESNFSMVSVHGEVSQPTVSTNGHLYFTLKDEGAQLSCVMWRTTRLRTETQLVQGQQITAFGGIKIYAPSGRYQLLVEQVQQAGVGALQAAFERLKKKLDAEGLFDPARKRLIPRFPKAIGVITSETSAAWQDITVNIEKRWPNVLIRLYHASTQGANAAPELVKGLQYFAQNLNVDTIIIGRGGGSIEDLWPFNEEAVARAIAESPIPVISGVGHETDFTISDFVADIRANTPTQAALIATPDKNELIQRVDDTSRFLRQSMIKKWQLKRQLVQRLIGSYALQKLRNKVSQLENQVFTLSEHIKNTTLAKFNDSLQLVNQFKANQFHLILMQRVNELEKMRNSLVVLMDKKMTNRIQQKHHFYIELDFRLKQANPLAPLEKGFTRILQDGKMIKEKQLFKPEKSYTIEWKDGKVNC